jgi:phosphatidylcholine synthase
MLLAMSIDAIDGTLARKARVAELIPSFDGRRLDDLVDYLNYVVVPALFLVWAGCVPHWAWTVLPVVASAYGFSQADAKTEDHFFLGFPSYWNVVAIYAYSLEISPPWLVAWLVGLSIAVFVPLKFVYPSQMRFLYWTTNLGALAWCLVLAATLAFPEPLAGAHLVELSLLYPAYYVGISIWLGGLRRRNARA